MTDTRPDAIDQKNAFQAGFRHGRDCGIVTNREAEEIMLSLRLPVSTATILCFQNGADDGALGDTFRYLLCMTN